LEEVKKETLGSYLKTKRLEKNISLEEIAADTKINTKVLDSLERDALNELPSSAFVRGFIRSYCKYIKLDQNKPLMLYDILYYGTSVDNELDKFIKKDLVKINKVSRKIFWWTTSFLSILFILGIIIYFVNSNYKIEKKKDIINIDLKQENINKASNVIDHNITKNEEIKEQVKEKIKEDVKPELIKGQELVIIARKLVWIKVQLDNNAPFDFMLAAEKKRILKAENQIKILIGDASAVKITYEGKELDNLGAQNAVRSIIFPGLERWR